MRVAFDNAGEKFILGEVARGRLNSTLFFC